MSDIVDNIALTIHLLNIIIGLLLFTFGIIGNFLSIFILTRRTFRNAPSVRYLMASSTANFIQLAQTLLPRILSDGFGIPIVKSNTQYCQARSIVAATATLCSLSYPCWASFDQFACTSQNAATRHNWTSKRFVYRAIFSTIIFWLIFYLPTNIATQAVGESCIGTNTIITYIYGFGVTPLAYSVFPIVAICYFNIGIVRNLRASRVTGLVQLNDRLARQVRRMLLPQLILLIISGIPFSIQTIYSLVTASIQKDPVRSAIENLILTIVRLLFYLNYACSFYIYIIMSSEVRKEFKKLFWKTNTILPQATALPQATIVIAPNVNKSSA
jgi:hypothetical protein